MKRLAGFILAALCAVFISAQACAGIAGAITREAIESTVDQAAKRSGRTIKGPVARKAAIDEVKHLSEKHGPDVFKIVEDSGLELLEAVPKYGDELLKIAAKASPQGRRALAMNVPELLPLAQRVGVDAIELEAKVPGQAAHVFQLFGDKTGKAVAKNVATEDLPRIIKYGQMADSEATRNLLLEAYQKEGRSLFERIPPNLVLASGLSVAMLYGTHEMTAPERAKADVLRNNPDIVRDVMNRSTAIWAGVALVLILVLLWRFGLMPWHRR
jgi:hypothetical protein